MAKKRKNPIPPDEWAALKAQWAENQRKLGERLEYHKARLEEERRQGLR
ncbi:MAG TPA: hypothetical protein VGJ77_03910 [Gaiellaceae bacterium]|jgi:hypothetical protein